MKLLAYLRFLRPLRSLVFVFIYTCIAAVFGGNLLHLDGGTNDVITLAVALPLLFGILIAGAAHEPMHRPFALLLPNLRQRQRTAAAYSVFIAAFTSTCLALWRSNQAISPHALFGLTCALSALPCIDRHRLLANQAAPLVAFFGWLFAGKALGPNLALALNAAPWLFLLVGLGVGLASLAQGFSRESVRARAHTLFIAYQTDLFSYVFHRGMVARRHAEVLAHRNQQGKRTAAGRDWTLRSVGTTSLDWMKVLWHERFGARKRNSFLHIQLLFAVMTLGAVAVVAGICYLFGATDYWAVLAQCAAPDPKVFDTKLSAGIGINFIMILPGTAMLCAMWLISPQLAYPISRARLARIVYWQTATQWIVALVVPATTIFIASLIGQVMSGRFLPDYGLPALLSADLPLAVLLPLMIAACTVRRAILRILTLVPICMAILVAAFSRDFWSSYIITPSGLLGVLVATAAAQWLLWHRLHRDYATADLTQDSCLAQLIRFSR